jgi:hypothetical protein
VPLVIPQLVPAVPVREWLTRDESQFAYKEFVDPRNEAEKMYDREAHAMHETALREADERYQPHSWLFWQWNSSFSCWERSGRKQIPYVGGYRSWISDGPSPWPTLAQLGVALPKAEGYLL